MREIYNTKKDELLNLLFSETEFKRDIQPDFDQVAVWCKTFGKDWSICFQNGDMNGKYKGSAIFYNEGANCGIDELLEILKERDELKCLIETEEYWKYEYLKELINEFISKYSDDNDMDNHFEDGEE